MEQNSEDVAVSKELATHVEQAFNKTHIMHTDDDDGSFQVTEFITIAVGARFLPDGRLEKKLDIIMTDGLAPWTSKGLVGHALDMLSVEMECTCDPDE